MVQLVFFAQREVKICTDRDTVVQACDMLEGSEGGIQLSFFPYYALLKQMHLHGVVRRKA